MEKLLLIIVHSILPIDNFAISYACLLYTSGSSVEGKDVIIIDDMISSGESMIDVATELKKRKANRIFVVATFGLFTNGLERFDEAVADGTIYKLSLIHI